MSAHYLLEAIYLRLSVSTIWTTLGGRINLGELPANTALPLMVYRVDSVKSGDTFSALERFDLTMSFSIYQSGSDGTAISTISDQLYSALSGRISPVGFDRLTMTRESIGAPSFEDDCWTMTDTYRGTAYLFK